MLKFARLLAKRLLGKCPWHQTDRWIPHEVLGSKYSGWGVVTRRLGPESIVYSFGVGDDITFDLALIERFGCRVFAFDPTPRSIEWVRRQNLPARFRFFPYGIGDHDGTLKMYAPADPEHVSFSVATQGKETPSADMQVKRLGSIMSEVGHSGIDVLKMDVEGAEYDILRDLFTGTPHISQLLVEFHHRFKPFGVAATKEAVRKIRAAGFLLFYLSPTGNEYGFIHRSEID